MTNIKYHTLLTLDDEYLEPYLDLYQTAFPLYEQMRISSLIRTIKNQSKGKKRESELLCALSEETQTLNGMAWFEVSDSSPCALLWYLAVTAKSRNAGIGSQMYQEILRRCLEKQPDLQAIAYEVERPDQAHDLDERALAERRIRFYQRQGGKLASNIKYTQSVGWQKPVPMFLMIHPLHPSDMESQVALTILQSAFGDSMEPVEDVILD